MQPMRSPIERQPRKDAAARARQDGLADDVRFYLTLTPRQLPSRFLYDALGSSLFEAICHLPWYRVTRAEQRLLEQRAADVGRIVGRRARVVELGSGSGEKLATLLSRAGFARVQAHLIDLSGEALKRSVQVLANVDGPELEVRVHRATYEEGLLSLPARAGGPTLVAFLGSNIGNFDGPGAAAFLRLIRSALQPGDYLLLGADLVKPEQELILAYDDPLGVTAAFNKNLLLRLNSELDANFALDRFGHRAVWNAEDSRVEMHLVSLVRQEVAVPGAHFSFTMEAGETIWTESSYKYEPDGIARLVESGGFVTSRQWIDEDDRFALTLFEAVV